MMRFIVLSNPAVCCNCLKMLKTGRGAFWSAGLCMCVKCMGDTHGEAEITDEEKRMLDELMAGNTNPQFVPDPVPTPKKARRGEP